MDIQMCPVVPAQVVVVGGGYIGLETTAGMVVNDLKVTLVDPAAAFRNVFSVSEINGKTRSISYQCFEKGRPRLLRTA